MDFPLATKFCLQDEIALYGWSIGDHTYGAPFIFEHGLGELTIGRFCSIAAGSTLILANHRTDLVSTYPFRTLSDLWPGAEHGVSDHVTRGGVHIESDVWLGAHCTVVAGVRVGTGAIIAANSVVTKDVPPYAVMAGNPARIVRHRCTDEQIQELLAIAWWDWPDDKVKGEIASLTTLTIDEFIARYRTAS